jgi:hypothetical protein
MTHPYSGSASYLQANEVRQLPGPESEARTVSAPDSEYPEELCLDVMQPSPPESEANTETQYPGSVGGHSHVFRCTLFNTLSSTPHILLDWLGTTSMLFLHTSEPDRCSCSKFFVSWSETTSSFLSSPVKISPFIFARDWLVPHLQLASTSMTNADVLLIEPACPSQCASINRFAAPAAANVAIANIRF